MPSANLGPPLGGWNTFDAMVGMKLDFAPVLDNLLPDQGRLRMRPGYRNWSTGLPGRVGGLMAYRSAGVGLMFAASGTGIYDVSASGAVGSAVVTGLTSAAVDGLTVAAAGGTFLLIYNGVDQEKTFNGTTWANWTATGISMRIGWATTFKSQVFCGRRDKLSFWYGAAAAIGGAYNEFPLQGVAKKGGGIAGAIDWTLDSGQGPDDRMAFVTTEGEVIVYSGLNPASSSTWSLVGVFSLPRPLGGRFLKPFGGDVLVLTEGGVFPLSAVVAGIDEGALASKAYTQRIEPTFLNLARARSTLAGWEVTPLPSYGLWLVNVPWTSSNAQQVMFRAANGAMARSTGLAAACWLETGGRAFFGHASEGKVLVWGEDTSDAGMAIQGECVQAFSDFEAAGLLKRFTLMQPIVAGAAGASIRAEMAIDWLVPPPEADVGGSTYVPPALGSEVAIWGVAHWGSSMWGGGLSLVSRAWQSARGIGQSGAVRLRVTSGYERPEWLGTAVVYERGGPLR